MTAAIGVQTSLPPLVVDHVDVGNQKISFDVDQPGTPVLVRISWFPNWRAHGAKGPYRVAPDFMVVVPTKNHVSLTYEYTKIELASIAVSLIGLSILVLSARRSLKERRLRRTNPKPGH